jgi:hypothetical protein
MKSGPIGKVRCAIYTRSRPTRDLIRTSTPWMRNTRHLRLTSIGPSVCEILAIGARPAAGHEFPIVRVVHDPTSIQTAMQADRNEPRVKPDG